MDAAPRLVILERIGGQLRAHHGLFLADRNYSAEIWDRSDAELITRSGGILPPILGSGQQNAAPPCGTRNLL